MQMLVKILTGMLTPTTGGRAYEIDILPKSLSNDAAGHGLCILLTDDDDTGITATTGAGAVCVFEWDGWRSGYKAGSGLAFPGLLLP